MRKMAQKQKVVVVQCEMVLQKPSLMTENGGKKINFLWRCTVLPETFQESGHRDKKAISP